MPLTYRTKIQSKSNNLLFFEFLFQQTIDTGGSHNSSDFNESNVRATASGSPGEQASQTCRGPSGFGLDT